MKGVMILFCLFYISSVSALPSIEIYNENYQPSETIVGNISGINQTLNSGDLKFFEGRREVSFEKGLVNSGANAYFYVIFNREGNFSLKLEGLFYYENGSLKSANLEKNFEVKKKENFSQTITIRPGVIFTDGEVELSLINSGEQIVNYSYGKNNKSSLEIGETEKIKIFPTEKFSLFEIKSYETFLIPIVYLINDKQNNTENETIEKIISLRVVPTKIEIRKNESEKFIYSIELFNFGMKNLTKITVNKKLDFLKISSLSEMAGRSAVNLTIEGTAKERGFFEDNITISYTENGSKEELKIPFTLYVFALNASEEEIKQSLSCFELGGNQLCNADETCEKPVSASNGNCCMSCKKNSSDSSSGLVVGILIILFLGVVAFALYKKFKDVKPKNKLISS